MTTEEIPDELYLVRLTKKGSSQEENEYSFRAVGFLLSKLDAEAEEILEELYQMCLAKKKRPFQGDNKPRVRELGHRLYELGGDDGHELMCQVRDQLPEAGQEDLEYVWQGVGDWSS